MDTREAEREKTDRWEADAFPFRRLLAGRRTAAGPAAAPAWCQSQTRKHASWWERCRANERATADTC